MLLYDVTNEHSFMHIRQWVADVEEISSRTVPLMIIGNKTDLRDQVARPQHFVVSNEEGKKVAVVSE